MSNDIPPAEREVISDTVAEIDELLDRATEHKERANELIEKAEEKEAEVEQLLDFFEEDNEQ